MRQAGLTPSCRCYWGSRWVASVFRNERIARFAIALLLLVFLSGCRKPQPSIILTRVPDALPRVASDTFGRLEFDLRTGDMVGCDDCTVSMGRPGAPLEDAGSISGGTATKGMFGLLAGPYELRIEGPGIVPFRQQLEVPLRQTTHAAIQLVPRHPR